VKPEVLASLGRSPEEFAQLVCWVYKERHEDSETAVEVTDVSEEERDRARYAFNILFHWTGYPGIDVPADRHEEREERVLAWSEKALDLTRNAKRQATGEHAVAAVLARVPKAADGHWPCLAARRLVETGSYPELMTGLVIAHRNLRGVTVRNFAEGGVQERALAASLRSSADAVEEDFPNTALMLRDLARAYERWGEREDVSARADRWRYR
jgi:hypothetical protein